MALLNPNSRVVRTGQLLESEVDGEVIALDIEKGQCYGLNGVGSRIWKLLATETTPADICDAVMAEYEVDRDTCEADVGRILRSLEEEGLIEIG